MSKETYDGKLAECPNICLKNMQLPEPSRTLRRNGAALSAIKFLSL